MTLDFSEKGREKFYEEIFKRLKEIRKEKIPDADKYKVINQYLENIEGYEHQRKMYKEQLNIFWDTKKSHLINCSREKEILGTISLESQEREESIKRCETRLRKMSSSFNEDLEKIIRKDPKVTNIHIDLN